MPGLYGGTVTGGALAEMGDRIGDRPAYERRERESDGLGLGLVRHGSEGPGDAVVDRNGVRGAVYGAISNLDELGLTVGEVVERALEEPLEALAPLDGPFAVVALDRDAARFVAATDKLGTRPLYYQTETGVTVSSGVAALLPEVDDPTVNDRTLADLVTMGYAWNGKTLVTEVERLPPATVLDYDAGAGAVHTTRYWTPNYEPALPSRTYLVDLVNRYREATEEMAGTLGGDVGLWLSGGLDSRSLAAGLAGGALPDDASLTGYTYDANPASGGNPELARRIGTAKGFPVEEVRVGSDDFARAAADLVDATDGLVRLTNTAGGGGAICALASTPDVMLEACGQGELLGERVWRPHIRRAASPADSIRRTEASTDPDVARALLSGRVDPTATFRRAVSRSDQSGLIPTVMDAHMQNHYTAGHFTGNAVTRRFADTRTQFADTAFLEHVARLPLTYHLGSLPLTGGRVPRGTTTPKLDLVRSLDHDLATIPYERTKLPPTSPAPLHTAGYVLGRGTTALEKRFGLAEPEPEVAWYRTDEEVRSFFDRHLDAAGDRSCFDGDAVSAWRDGRRDGADRLSVLASVVTAECWLERHLD